MLKRQLLFCLLTCLSATTTLDAQSVNLTETPRAEHCFRNEMTMTLQGKITVRQQDKDASFPHQASAKHVFLERFIDLNGPVADKAARFYTTAERSIRFNSQPAAKSTLRPERSFMVAQRTKDKIVSFSPKGALTREEVELTEHLDTMAVAGLLPGKTLEVGKTWTIPNHVVLGLCDLEGLLQQDLEGKLESVKDALAHIKIVGKVQGVDQGAAVSMLVNARLTFDTKGKCVTALEWKLTEEREQGPVSPTIAAEVTFTLKRTPIDVPEQLNKFALVPVPTTATPPSELTNILHEDARKRFTLRYARDWHVVNDHTQLVMRLIDRGDLIAQATVTPWKKADPKNVLTLKAFADLMAQTPGWREEKEIERKALNDGPKGQAAVYRIASSGLLANGAAEPIRTVQYFYLIVGSNGEQLIVTFSMTPQQVQRFENRDLEFVRALAFPARDNSGR